MIICVCKKLKESNNWDSIQKNEWFQPKSQQLRERERECEHERKNVFETHSKLLKFANARIESASVGRELTTGAHDILKDYVTTVATMKLN